MGMFDGLNLDWGQLATGDPTPMLQPGGMPAQAPNFNDRFGAAFPRSPISPENMASNLAARGVPPPPVDIPPQNGAVGAALTGNEVINPGQPFRMADQQSVDDWRNSVDVNNAGVGGSPAKPGVGGPSPGAPMNIQSPVQEQQVAAANAPTDVSAKKKEGDSLLDALKGVKAPAAPELQRLGTPSAPRPHSTVKGGQLLALLQSLNVGQGAGDRNLPSTLNSALRRG